MWGDLVADYRQMTMFDLLKEPEAGDWVEHHGRQLTFPEIAEMVGKKIIMDKSAVSHEWFKCVTVERIVQTSEGRRLVYYDGHPQRGMVNEHWFTAARNPARAYAL